MAGVWARVKKSRPRSRPPRASQPRVRRLYQMQILHESLVNR